MEFITDLKALVPDYAKDIRLNLDAVLARSSLSPAEATGVALAAAFAAKSAPLVEILSASTVLSEQETQAVLTAASLMAMTNIWYSYLDMARDNDLKNLPAQLRMNAYQNHGGVDRRRFELYALAASIVGKCHFCVSSHAAVLKEEGLSSTELRDIGRIAAVIQAVAQVVAVSSSLVER